MAPEHARGARLADERGAASRGKDRDSAAARDKDCGSAVVEFVLVAPLLVAIALVVLQAALAIHVRTTLTAAAAEGARTAALAGVQLQAGEQRTRQLLAGNLAEGLVTDVHAARDLQDGQLVTSVTVQARLPLVGLLGLTTMQVTGHAIQERA